MKALVTGANGLIGANLVRELLAAGYDVRAMVRSSSNVSSLAGLAVEQVIGDILEPETLIPAAQGCEVIFHTAAVFAYGGYQAAELDRIAVQGTQNLLAAAAQARVRRVVLTSSSVVFGSSDRPVVRDETFTLQEPDAPAYILAKAAQEQVAFAQAKELGLEVVAVCPTIVVGPYDVRLGPSNGLIIAYLTDPFKMTFPGGCNIVSAADVARGHRLAAEEGRPGRRYILGAENLEWPAIHGLISELCGLQGPYFFANHTASYLAATAAELLAAVTRQPPLTTRAQAKMVGRYYWYRHNKAAALGYKPGPARQALAQAIAWLAASPHVSRQLRSALTLSREVYAARKTAAGPGD
jgi:dihydroflavonol-4-reductase